MATPPAPTVPDLVLAPELAAIMLLEHALDVAKDSLVAQHPTLIDDFHCPREQGAVVFLAHLICQREAVLRKTLWRYRCAVRDAVARAPEDTPDDEAF